MVSGSEGSAISLISLSPFYLSFLLSLLSRIVARLIITDLVLSFSFTFSLFLFTSYFFSSICFSISSSRFDILFYFKHLFFIFSMGRIKKKTFSKLPQTGQDQSLVRGASLTLHSGTEFSSARFAESELR